MAETKGNQNFGSIPRLRWMSVGRGDQMRRCGKREELSDMEGGSRCWLPVVVGAARYLGTWVHIWCTRLWILWRGSFVLL